MNVQHLLTVTLFVGLCLSFSPGCGGGDNAEQAIAPPMGAAHAVDWDPSPDVTVSSYNVYYGTRSRGESNACDYEYVEQTSSHSVTLKALHANTRYFVAVSAFNGQDGPCSAEISFVTGPGQ